MLAGGADDNGHLPQARRALRVGGMGSPPPGQATSTPPPHPAPPPCTDYDMAYFRAYSHIGVHEEMLKDHVRTNSYRNAIMNHQDLISGKVVLDVGCGTGVLSVCSCWCLSGLCSRCKRYCIAGNGSCERNDLSDKVIVLHGRIEDVDIEEKVDVIISEWMGYMLLHESMLGSVIFARDKWLTPGGLILPSHASLYLAPITNSQRYQDSIYFWRDVYGIKMSSMMPLAKQCAFLEPSVETMSGENVLTWPTVVAQVDCYTVQASDLEIIPLHISLHRCCKLHCMDLHFGLMSSLTDQFAKKLRSKQANPRMGTCKMPAQAVKRKNQMSRLFCQLPQRMHLLTGSRHYCICLNLSG